MSFLSRAVHPSNHFRDSPVSSAIGQADGQTRCWWGPYGGSAGRLRGRGGPVGGCHWGVRSSDRLPLPPFGPAGTRPACAIIPQWLRLSCRKTRSARALRAGWQRSPDAIEPLSGGPAAPAWLVDDHVLVRVPADRRAQLEAGCGAALHLAGAGHRGGGAGAHARRRAGRHARRRGVRPGRAACPAARSTAPTRSTSSGGATCSAARTGRWTASPTPGWPAGTGSARTPPTSRVEPWLRPAVAGAVAALTRLSVTDRLTYGVLHGDPLPGAFRLDPHTGRTGLLHWGYAATGPLVFDLAVGRRLRRRRRVRPTS